MMWFFRHTISHVKCTQYTIFFHPTTKEVNAVTYCIFSCLVLYRFYLLLSVALKALTKLPGLWYTCFSPIPTLPDLLDCPSSSASHNHGKKFCNKSHKQVSYKTICPKKIFTQLMLYDQFVQPEAISFNAMYNSQCASEVMWNDE